MEAAAGADKRRRSLEAQQLQRPVGAAADRLAIAADLQQYAVGLRHDPLHPVDDKALEAIATAIAQHHQASAGGEQLGGFQAAQQGRREAVGAGLGSHQAAPERVALDQLAQGEGSGRAGT